MNPFLQAHAHTHAHSAHNAHRAHMHTVLQITKLSEVLLFVEVVTLFNDFKEFVSNKLLLMTLVIIVKVGRGYLSFFSWFQNVGLIFGR